MMSPWGGLNNAPRSPRRLSICRRARQPKERVRPPRRPAALETALAGPRHLVPDDGMLSSATVATGMVSLISWYSKALDRCSVFLRVRRPSPGY